MSPIIRTLALALPLLAALAPAPAAAVVASTNTTFYFTGTCSDCTGTVKAELVLSNYSLGQQITGFYGNGNFVSFHYDGSDLISEFTISAPDGTASGTINNPLPGPQQVNISNGPFLSGYYFTSGTDGTWSVGKESGIEFLTFDQGTAGTFSLAAAATAVPEPTSLALLSAGLLGLRLTRRRPKAG